MQTERQSVLRIYGVRWKQRTASRNVRGLQKATDVLQTGLPMTNVRSELIYLRTQSLHIIAHVSVILNVHLNASTRYILSGLAHQGNDNFSGIVRAQLAKYNKQD